MHASKYLLWVTAATLFVAAVAFGQGKGKATGKGGVVVPLGLQAIQWPADNPYSAEKVELGRMLYFDTRLSADGTVSCASCHAPDQGWTDNAPVSTGIKGQKGGRSAPATINRAYSQAQFWDGRAASLEVQAVGPIANPIEMGETYPNVTKKLSAIPGYQKLFHAAFGSPDVTVDKVGKAIATFERTLLSGNSAYDRYKAGNKRALTSAQVRGMDVFFNKAKCDACHEGSNFTLNSFNNLGVGTDKPNPDEGRAIVTKKAEDWGAFKTPTLRDIAKSGPYMHDGSLKTLEEVVEFYNKGGIPNKNLDARMVKLNLTEGEKKDLVEFLKALDGTPIPVVVPTAFPQ